MAAASNRLRRWHGETGDLSEHHDELEAEVTTMLAQHYREVAPGSKLPAKKYAYIPITAEMRRAAKDRENNLPVDRKGNDYTANIRNRNRWRKSVGLSPFPGLLCDPPSPQHTYC